MDEIELESKASSSLISRSPNFHKAEVKALLHLINKNKTIILNKLTNASANQAKEREWNKIAEEFNKLRLGQERSAEVLKTKWENLKRSAKKVSKDIDDECDFNKDDIINTVRLICEERICDLDEENLSLKSIIGCGDDAELKIWASDDEEDSFCLDDDGNRSEIQRDRSKKLEVSTGFSPRDCRVLLQCVRQEKNVLFSNTSLFKRQQAWKRITETFNCQSPQKRTSKELSKKFNTLKSMARRVNVKGFFKDKKRKKYEQLCDSSKSRIKVKSEPIVCTEFDLDSDDDKEIVVNNPIESALHERLDFTQDPLNNAHGSNSESGFGSIPETKDVTRLKLELLNYKMETAMLERKRIEEAIKGEQKEREMRAAEQSLRLRAARLEVAAAEAKLPPSHPALKYALDEKLAMF